MEKPKKIIMRDIKYKGKLSHSGEWVIGNLIIACNGNPYIIPFDVFVPDGHHLMIDSDKPFWVDSETVGQYTGRKDKNGKEIYEGDIIINMSDSDEKAIAKSVIIFKDCSFCMREFYRTNWSGNETSINQYDFRLSKIGIYEVIGNIHEN
jgi:hypothetical protein